MSFSESITQKNIQSSNQSLGRFLELGPRELLTLRGKDTLDLLQRLSTNDLSRLRIGEHAETVLTTEKGRIVDVISILRKSADTILVLGQSGSASDLRQWIQKFIVMEDTVIEGAGETRTLYLVFDIKKPESSLVEQTNSYILFYQIREGQTLFQVMNNGTDNSSVDRTLAERGFRKATAEEFERFRILNRIPSSPHEINAHFNPLELGLMDLVSFSKGCYVGQEVIARLDTYDKVQRAIQRFELTTPPRELPADLTSETGVVAGTLTSFTHSVQGGQPLAGLGVVKKEFLNETLSFESPNSVPRGVAIPF